MFILMVVAARCDVRIVVFVMFMWLLVMRMVVVRMIVSFICLAAGGCRGCVLRNRCRGRLRLMRMIVMGV